MNLPYNYPHLNSNVPDSSEYLKSKKTSELYIGINKKNKNKNKNKIINRNSNQNVLNYNIGKAYYLNYPA